MLSALIIEDEKKQLEALTYLLCHNQENRVKVIGDASNVSDAVSQINKLQPDLVFMDIQLKDGSAFDVLKRITFQDFCLIFTTAYQEHALLAFKYNAIDYLLKPIDGDELHEAIKRATIINNRTTSALQIRQLEHNLNKAPESIILPTQEQKYIVSLKDLIRCETSGSYTTFHLLEGKKIMVSKPLKSYDDLLCPPLFFRIHQSHTINLSFVKSYSRNGTLTLTDGTILQVAQRKKEEFLTIFNG